MTFDPLPATEALPTRLITSLSELEEALTAARRPSSHIRLGAVLVEDGVLSEADLEKALEHQKSHPHVRLGEVLCRTGITSEARIRIALARQLGIPAIDLYKVRPDPLALSKVPEHLADKHTALPVTMLGQHLVVAMADPLNQAALEELGFGVSGDAIPVVAAEAQIRDLITDVYSLADEDLLTLDSPPVAVKGEAEGSPAVVLWNELLRTAVRRGASDVHMVPRERDVEISMRIDGTVVFWRAVNLTVGAAMYSRMKSLAGLDTTKIRKPQDGHVRARLNGRRIDLRISTIPARFGESLVVRVLDPEATPRALSRIGFNRKDINAIRKMLNVSHGLCLVCGPTGSGKSTTLAAALAEVVNSGRRVLTIEDPVEYQLKGTTQIQIDERAGYTFPKVLRHVLRQDPDVIMIGEIRDEETAQIAVQAALTGHLVLSTIHADSAAAAVVRLIDMGVPDYLVRSSLIGLIAQRLVRKNCPSCLVPIREPDSPKISGKVYQGLGCRECGGLGYRGRLPVYELLPVSRTLRASIRAGVADAELLEQALAEGHRPLWRDAQVKARAKRAYWADIKALQASPFGVARPTPSITRTEAPAAPEPQSAPPYGYGTPPPWGGPPPMPGAPGGPPPAPDAAGGYGPQPMPGYPMPGYPMPGYPMLWYPMPFVMAPPAGYPSPPPTPPPAKGEDDGPE